MKLRLGYVMVFVLGLSASSSAEAKPKTDASGEPTAAEIKALAAQVVREFKALRATREQALAAYGRAAEAQSGKISERFVRLRLVGSLGHGSTVIDGVFDGRAFRLLQGKTDREPIEFHPVRVESLSIDGEVLKAKVVLTAASEPHRDRTTGVRSPVVFTIEARVSSDGQVRGRYETDGYQGGESRRTIEAHAGGVSGLVSGLTRSSAYELPQWPLVSPNPEGFYKEAQWLDVQGRELYADVVAASLALQEGVPFAIAREWVSPREALYPAMPVKGGRKGPGPSLDGPRVKGPQKVEDDPLGLDGIMGDSKGLGGPGGSRGGADASKYDLARLHALMSDIHANVARMHALTAAAKAIIEQSGNVKAARSQEKAIEDPHFGPWYGMEALPEVKGGAHRVDAVDPQGKQRWAYVSQWKLVGPLESKVRHLAVPHLPAFMAPTLVSMKTPRDFLRGETPLKDVSTWVDGWQHGQYGRTYTPNWKAIGHSSDFAMSGYPNSTLYARTTLHSTKEQEVYFALGVNDHGMLWINERLAWRSDPDRHFLADEVTGICRVKLAKGENRVLLRVDNDYSNMFFRMAVCMAGSPRDRNEYLRAASRIHAKSEQLADPHAKFVGWRNHFDGRYEGNVKPVTAWDLEKRTNIKWRVPMSWCRSTPVVVGDKVFTQEEPHVLICLDKKTGKEFWRRESNVLELTHPQLMDEYRKGKEAYEKARETMSETEGDMQETIAAWTKEGMSQEDATAKYMELRRSSRRGDHMELMRRKAGVSMPVWGDFFGHTFATPVTDGKHIWVKYGTGVAACYDMEGTRKWMSKTDGFSRHYSTCPSPLLVDGKLIMEVPFKGTEKEHEGEAVLIGFDASSGERLYKSDVYRNDGYSGSPLAMQLTNGSESMTVIISAGGAALRADDGQLLVADVGTRSGYSSPVKIRNRVYFNHPGIKSAVEFFMVDRDQVGARLLWRWNIESEYSAGQVRANGLLFGLQGGQSCGPLQVIDPKTGLLVSNISGIIPYSGRAYVPPTVADGKLFTADDGRKFAAHRTMPGTMAVVDPARDGVVLARSYMEGLHAAPVFDGDRMYVRTKDSMMCIAYTGEEGKAYEAMVNAKCVMEALFADRPAGRKPIAIKPSHDFKCPHKWTFGWRSDIKDWKAAGPFDGDAAQRVIGALKQQKMLVPDGDAITVNGAKVAFAKLDSKHMRDGWFNHRRVEVNSVVEGKSGKVFYLLSEVIVDKDRTMRLELHTPGARAWLGGVEVKHNDRIAASRGNYQLLLEVKAVETDKPWTVCPIFHPTGDDAAAEAKHWAGRVERYRPYLERVIQLCPKTEEAFRAGRMLGDVGK